MRIEHESRQIMPRDKCYKVINSTRSIIADQEMFQILLLLLLDIKSLEYFRTFCYGMNSADTSSE